MVLLVLSKTMESWIRFKCDLPKRVLEPQGSLHSSEHNKLIIIQQEEHEPIKN